MILITAARIRSLISACRTDADITAMLRGHKIRYTYTTEGGELAIRIPTRKGALRIIRNAPGKMIIHNSAPVPYYPTLYSEEA